MTTRKRIGLFLIVSGALVLGTGGFLWRKDAPARERLQTSRAVLEDSLKKVNAELVETSLLLRGFRNSQSSMPDTLRRFGGKMLMDIAAGYNKKIRKLDRYERDIKLEIAAIDRKAVQADARVRGTVLPIAGGGLVVLVFGVVLTLTPARRVDA